MARLEVHVGTSGWTYDDWTGVFYPPDVKAADRLSFYATQFDAVEINATFYRLATQSMIDAWNRRLPSQFHLAVKGHRQITHLKRLEDIEEPLGAFLDRVLKLRTLRVILWQLPPSFRKDVARLERFLSHLPGSVRHAVEFRHTSWWSPEVATVLAQHRAGFVAVSHPRLPPDVIPTADFLYVRFHGLGRELYRYDYSAQELAEWAKRLKPHLAGRTLYAFFNNDFDAHAPHNAVELRKMLLGHHGA